MSVTRGVGELGSRATHANLSIGNHDEAALPFIDGFDGEDGRQASGKLQPSRLRETDQCQPGVRSGPVPADV